jgi:RNA polymerase sigma-70 factor (ECF subfamily)
MDKDHQRFWDDQVQTALAEGDFRGALEALVRGYQREIVGFCVNMLGNTEQGTEIAQEVFLAAYKALPQFRQESSLRTWLFAIARNQCRKLIRDQDRHSHKLIEHQTVISQAAHATPAKAPDDLLQEEEKMQRLAHGIRQLEETTRALLLLRYDRGLPISEIAHIFGISVPTACRRLVQALQQIRKEMEQ